VAAGVMSFITMVLGSGLFSSETGGTNPVNPVEVFVK
jgi:hypothetical protein